MATLLTKEEQKLMAEALVQRKSYRSCTECDEWIEDGFDHAETCPYHAIEKKAQQTVQEE